MVRTFAPICFAFAMIATLGMAQDLDTTYVSDEFTSGSRGNPLGTGPTFNNSLTDGTEFQDITNTDGVTGTIRYINAFAGATGGETESPCLDVTAAQDNPDRLLVGAIEAIPASGGASPGAVLIGDDGGFNALFFGETDDSNYFVQVDVYCYDRTSTPTLYESHSLAFRCARDNDPNETGGSYTMDRAGSYALTWDAHLGIVSARRWNVNTSSAPIYNRETASFTEFAQQPLTEGWHTFRIEGLGSTITFSVDGSVLATAIDSVYADGRAGLVYREGGGTTAITPNEDETQAYFDNLRAGPTPVPSVTAVSMFELYN